MDDSGSHVPNADPIKLGETAETPTRRTIGAQMNGAMIHLFGVKKSMNPLSAPRISQARRDPGSRLTHSPVATRANPDATPFKNGKWP